MLPKAGLSYFLCTHWPFSIFLSTVPTDWTKHQPLLIPPMHVLAIYLYTDEHLLTLLILALQMEAASNTLAALPTCIQYMYFIL
jgi:hypothetical protein